jgi:hypothetical protein
MKRATVYVRELDLLFHCDNLTVDGVWIIGTPVRAMSAEAKPEDIGREVRTALNASKQNVPQPSDWSAVATPLLAVAGVKAWSSLLKASSICLVAADEHRLTLTPTRNGGATGPDRGFHELSSAQLEIPLAAVDRDLGDAIVTAASRCLK